MRKRIVWMMTTLLAASLTACDEGVFNPVADIVFPATGVSFNGHVQPLFDMNCAVSGCHDIYGYTQTGIIRLEGYTDLFERPGLVRPGDSTGSVLAQVLRGELVHPRDPLFTALTENQRRGVIRWIHEGASNN